MLHKTQCDFCDRENDFYDERLDGKVDPNMEAFLYIELKRLNKDLAKKWPERI